MYCVGPRFNENVELPFYIYSFELWEALVQFITKLVRKHCRMLVGLNWAYQSAVYTAQDEKSKDSVTQEMRSRKGNIGTHSVWSHGVGKVKDADFGLCQGGYGTNK